MQYTASIERHVAGCDRIINLITNLILGIGTDFRLLSYYFNSKVGTTIIREDWNNWNDDDLGNNML